MPPARRAEFTQPGVSTPGGEGTNIPSPAGPACSADPKLLRRCRPYGAQEGGRRTEPVLGLTPQAEQIPPCGREPDQLKMCRRGWLGASPGTGRAN